MDKAHARIVAALVLTVLIMVLGLTAPPVRADTFNPNPPVAGQPFTISGVQTPGAVGSWQVSSACGGGTIYQVGIDTGAAPFTFTDHISALPAGTYYFSHQFDSTDCSSTGGFTVDPAPTSTPIPVGGTLLPIKSLQVLLPWLVLVTLLGTVSVWTLVVKRRR